MYSLVVAANFLGNELLVENSSKAVAEMIKQLPVPEIEALFDLELPCTCTEALALYPTNHTTPTPTPTLAAATATSATSAATSTDATNNATPAPTHTPTHPHAPANAVRLSEMGVAVVPTKEELAGTPTLVGTQARVDSAPATAKRAGSHSSASQLHMTPPRRLTKGFQNGASYRDLRCGLHPSLPLQVLGANPCKC